MKYRNFTEAVKRIDILEEEKDFLIRNHGMFELTFFSLNETQKVLISPFSTVQEAATKALSLMGLSHLQGKYLVRDSLKEIDPQQKVMDVAAPIGFGFYLVEIP